MYKVTLQITFVVTGMVTNGTFEQRLGRALVLNMSDQGHLVHIPPATNTFVRI